MWEVIQHRYIRDSSQNGSNIVWTGGRYKDARGQAKSNLNSHLDMVFRHDHFPFADVTIDIDNHSAVFEEDGEVVYSIRYEVRENVL